jgi:hypothetical protein
MKEIFVSFNELIIFKNLCEGIVNIASLTYKIKKDGVEKEEPIFKLDINPQR